MTDSTWKGTTDHDYSIPLNWSAGVPGPTDTGFFDATAATAVIFVLSGLQDVAAWTFNGGDYFITVSGHVVFEGAGVHVNAGSATIDAFSGGLIEFDGNSDGGAAQYIIASGGTLDFSLNAGPIVHAGSIEGGGTFSLGANQLTVGSNNLSTTVSGTIGGTLGSGLTKVGTGTLTLTGTYTSPGAVTIAGGTFISPAVLR